MSKLETNTIDTVSGTSTLQVGSTNTSTITLGVSGDTINVPSGVTIANSGTATGFGGANTPNFSVQDNAVQAIPNNTITKLVWQTEDWDTASAFASDKFTVPSGQAGKYFFFSSWQFATADNFNEMRIYLYKNGSSVDPNIQGYHDHYGSIQISKVINLSVGDYVEVYAFQNSGSQQNTLGNNVFQGYKIIE